MVVSNIFSFHPHLGKWSILTSIFFNWVGEKPPIRYIPNTRGASWGIIITLIWMFPKIVVPPKWSILIGFSIVNHPFWGTPIFGNTHMLRCNCPTGHEELGCEDSTDPSSCEPQIWVHGIPMVPWCWLWIDIVTYVYLGYLWFFWGGLFVWELYIILILFLNKSKCGASSVLRLLEKLKTPTCFMEYGLENWFWVVDIPKHEEAENSQTLVSLWTEQVIYSFWNVCVNMY